MALLALLLAAAAAPRQAAAEAPAPAPRGTLVALVARAEVADPQLAAELRALGGPDAQRFVLELGEGAPPPGVDARLARAGLDPETDRALAARIEACDVLELRGGSFMGWYATVLPGKHRTLVYDALLYAVRARTKVVIAYGGAAAFFSSGTTIARDELDEPLRNPRRAETQVPRVAMGLGPPALLGSDDWPDGSPLRWLHSLWRTRMKLGLYFVGEVAVLHDWEAQRLRVLGPGSVVLCDLASARRQKRSLEGARLTRLERGDGWDFGYKGLVAGAGVERVTAGLADAAPGLRAAAVGALASGPALAAALLVDARPLPAEAPARLELDLDVASAQWRRAGRRTWAGVTARLEWDAPLFQAGDAPEPGADLERPRDDVH